MIGITPLYLTTLIELYMYLQDEEGEAEEEEGEEEKEEDNCSAVESLKGKMT